VLEVVCSAFDSSCRAVLPKHISIIFQGEIMSMKSIAKLAVSVLFFALVIVLAPNNADAQGRHPAYLHALTDLRHARAHLDHGDGGQLRHEESEAIRQIDAAIAEIKKASIDDGKDLNDHPPVDAGLDYTGRLHRAMQLLDKAQEDISHEEDNQFAQGLQQRALSHIDRARHEVGEAIRIVASR
jgi:hypothetical protein